MVSAQRIGVSILRVLAPTISQCCSASPEPKPPSFPARHRHKLGASVSWHESERVSAGATSARSLREDLRGRDRDVAMSLLTSAYENNKEPFHLASYSRRHTAWNTVVFFGLGNNPRDLEAVNRSCGVNYAS
ncbi:hypothetical protein B0T14DRAFT_62667 [Immersiella caudata]|uniref:Uncharacterized protein n=1 Tax=Immersiella caudata TaxID=314043 RepID=A0AA39XG06_9PEZI|nr:hypothetical protein B0T14DRAFT_62667 [Immersiella caudata]